MKVYWTPDARIRLREIEAYIAKDAPLAARNMATRLIRRSMEFVCGTEVVNPDWCEARELRCGLANGDLQYLSQRLHELVCGDASLLEHTGQRAGFKFAM